MDGSGDGPDIIHPLIDWSHELSYRWNKELIFLLSREFRQKVISGAEFPLLFDPYLMTEAMLTRSCTMKLQRIREKVHNAQSANGEEERAKGAAALRRNTRRQGVSAIPLHLHPPLTPVIQTLNRRMNTVSANRASKHEPWSSVEQVLSMLDVTGMSSDHTDEDASRGFKVVRCARMPWRSDSLTVLCHAIDTYKPSVMPHSRGNRSLPRLTQLSATSPTSGRQCVRGLPKSFYDPQWLASLSRQERFSIAHTPAIEIPHLVCLQ